MQFSFIGTFSAKTNGCLAALCGNEGAAMAFPEKSWCVTVCSEVSHFEQGGAFGDCIRPTGFTKAFLRTWRAWRRRITIANEANVDCANWFSLEKLLYEDFSVDRDLTRQHETLCNCRWLKLVSFRPLRRNKIWLCRMSHPRVRKHLTNNWEPKCLAFILRTNDWGKCTYITMILDIRAPGTSKCRCCVMSVKACTPSLYELVLKPKQP